MSPEQEKIPWGALLLSPFITVLALLDCILIPLLFIFVTSFKRRNWDEAIIRFWSVALLRLMDIHVVIEGVRHIPDTGVLFLFNHQSLFDIPVAHASIPKSFRFGAKIELFKIPIFSWAMRKSGALPIAREKLTETIRVYDLATVRIRSGESFMLAPEGTRQAEPRIGVFKTGPFALAIKAQAPIVPVVMTGVHRVLPKSSILLIRKKRTVYVDILPAVSTEGLNLDQRDQLKNQIREQMNQTYLQRQLTM